MKKRIVFNRMLRQWEIVGTGMAFDDLSVAYGIATGRLWVTPRPEDMIDAALYGFSAASLADACRKVRMGIDLTRTVRHTQDGTICLPNPERDF